MSTAVLLDRRTAEIYAKASLVFAAQLVLWLVQENWEWLLAAAAAWGMWQLVLMPDLPQFLSVVITDDGLHALGQRIFGVLSDAR